MPIKKNYLNSKLKSLRDDNITSFDDDDLNKPLSNNKGFDNELGKV
jgi:hypothetical protein